MDHQKFYADRGFDQAKATRINQETRANNWATQTRREASSKSFNDAMARNAAPLPMTTRSTDTFSSGSYSGTGSGRSGRTIAIIVGIALTILAVYAIAHGASLLAIGRTAVLGGIVLAAIGIVIVAIRFIRDHPVATMVVIGGSIYGYVHFFG